MPNTQRNVKNGPLWPCFACGARAWCAHREDELVEWAIARARETGAAEILDPLPAQPRRMPPARATDAARGAA